MQEQEKFSCIMVDWDYAYDLCRDVGEAMRDAGFKPDVIIGVARGGWYLA
ncbi:MAG TPA: phosphoribosyltransferase, partial [Methanophagales archaeon]|nr:phosphoribosyltransferase [Methanophagales archaeon]